MQLQDIFKLKEPWHTKKGLFIYSLYIFIFSLLMGVTIITALKAINNIQQYLLLIFIIIVFIPAPLYLIFALLWRSWLQIRFSNKVNVVIAYNLLAIDYQKYIKRYNKFIEELKNKINYHGLGRYIKIIEKQIDISFPENAAAEAKTKLGLIGSTLLIWGHVTKRKNKEIFFTKFSYEFSYPKWLRRDIARKIFVNIIEKGIEGGLFKLNRNFTINADIFSDNTFSAILFILGCTTASCGNFKIAEMLFLSFKKQFQDEDIPRKRLMGPALVEVNEILNNIYELWAGKALFKKDFFAAKENLEKAYKINPDDYLTNCRLAYYYEIHKKDRARAESFNKRAELRALRGFHLHRFNLAYFAISDKLYDKAIKIYEGIPDYTNFDVGAMQVLCHSIYEETKNAAFLFAEGYVVYRWKTDSEQEGRSILKDFIRIASTEINQFSYLINKANEII